MSEIMSIPNLNTNINLTTIGTGTVIAPVNSSASFYISTSCFHSRILTNNVLNTAYNLCKNPLIGAIYTIRNDAIQTVLLFPQNSLSQIYALTGILALGASLSISTNKVVSLIPVSTTVWHVIDDDILSGSSTPTFTPLYLSARSTLPQVFPNTTPIAVVFQTRTSTMGTDLVVTGNNTFTYNGVGTKIWYIYTNVTEQGGAPTFPQIYIYFNGTTTYSSNREIQNDAESNSTSMSTSLVISVVNGDSFQVFYGDLNGDVSSDAFSQRSRLIILE